MQKNYKTSDVTKRLPAPYKLYYPDCLSYYFVKQDMCSKTVLIINSGSGLASKLIWHANPDNWRPIHSKKRLKFPDYCKAMRLHNYLNFTLFTFNKIRILIQYLVAKIGMIRLRLGCR
ncbi:hypothetical protein GLOIN_2v677430 [Rhizophagus irregularis DAOM 181602=DAOM 197198]|nr:hypothetical protein GLOIN_2v677430 [Rhizophagus irregularis DAOM 181602=DAOM 197198]